MISKVPLPATAGNGAAQASRGAPSAASASDAAGRAASVPLIEEVPATPDEGSHGTSEDGSQNGAGLRHKVSPTIGSRWGAVLAGVAPSLSADQPVFAEAKRRRALQQRMEQLEQEISAKRGARPGSASGGGSASSATSTPPSPRSPNGPVAIPGGSMPGGWALLRAVQDGSPSAPRRLL